LRVGRHHGLTSVIEGAEGAVTLVLDRLPILVEDLVLGEHNTALVHDHLGDVYLLEEAHTTEGCRHEARTLLLAPVLCQLRKYLLVCYEMQADEMQAWSEGCATKRQADCKQWVREVKQRARRVSKCCGRNEQVECKAGVQAREKRNKCRGRRK
jgi:hypothetical protein